MDMFDLLYSNVPWQYSIERRFESSDWDHFGKFKMGNLAHCVDARVCSSSSYYGGSFSSYLMKGFYYTALNCLAIFLYLPTRVMSANVLQLNLVIGHYFVVQQIYLSSMLQ